jgi:hypothetical protein
MSDYLSIFPQPADPRLRRHVAWDDASRGFALPDPLAFGHKIPRAVQHVRQIPVLDQGDVGSCTANALLGCLGTEPFASQLAERTYGKVDLPAFDEALALAVYHEETILDEREIPGVYPPDDTGSAGLYAMKVAKRRGWVSSYRHGFSVLRDGGRARQRPDHGRYRVAALDVRGRPQRHDRRRPGLVDRRRARVRRRRLRPRRGRRVHDELVGREDPRAGDQGHAKIRLGDLRWLLYVANAGRRRAAYR